MIYSREFDLQVSKTPQMTLNQGKMSFVNFLFYFNSFTSECNESKSHLPNNCLYIVRHSKTNSTSERTSL